MTTSPAPQRSRLFFAPEFQPTYTSDPPTCPHPALPHGSCLRYGTSGLAQLPTVLTSHIRQALRERFGYCRGRSTDLRDISIDTPANVTWDVVGRAVTRTCRLQLDVSV